MGADRRIVSGPVSPAEPPAPSPPAVSTHNPYLAARKEWDERYGNLITRARNWRLITVVVAMVALVQGGGLIYLASKSRVVPFVVAIDSLDRVVASGPAQASNAADERLIRAALYQWVGDLRMVTTDGVAQRRAIDHVYSMIGNGTAAQVQISEFYSQDPPASRAQHETCSADVKAVFSTSDRTFQVEWSETTRSLNGQVLAQQNWKGSVTITVNPPSDERLARVNPLGIYVVAVSWSKVL